MADPALQERLRDHAKAFDGLLSLIPAKVYYGENTSEQWRAEKQTRDQASAARRRKLDPDSELHRNAKEVLDERARRKRKWQNSGGDHGDDTEGSARESSNHGPKSRRQHRPEARNPPNGRETITNVLDAECVPHGGSKLNEKIPAKRMRTITNAKRTGEDSHLRTPMEGDAGAGTPDIETEKKKAAQQHESSTTGTKGLSRHQGYLSEPRQNNSQSGRDSEGDKSLAVGEEPLLQEGHIPLVDTLKRDTPKHNHIKVPANTEALKARLAAKIEALRAARKADGANGRPIRTRQELLEARRAKQAQRKAHKQELRRQEKMIEEQKRDSLGPISPGITSPSLDAGDLDSCFTFGRVSFSDGSQLSHTLDYVLNRNGSKKKGPSDPKTALLRLQNQKKRLEELGEDKRKDTEEKELWLTARRRAEGDKIRDDETILKRAVRRKEQAKKKSKREWEDRTKSVERAREERQRKREDNIRRRKEEKAVGRSGHKGKNAGGPGATATRKRRPGFEGKSSFGAKMKQRA